MFNWWTAKFIETLDYNWDACLVRMAGGVSVVLASGFSPVLILNAPPSGKTFQRNRELFISATINLRARNATSFTSKKHKEMERWSFKDYLEHSKYLLGSLDGGPPRWFSPLECSSTLENSPLLLYLPGFLILNPHSNFMYNLWYLYSVKIV